MPLPFLDKKAASTSIISQRGKSPDIEVKTEASPGDDSGLQSAAQSILRALESKSASDLSRALQDFIYICGANEESEE